MHLFFLYTLSHGKNCALRACVALLILMIVCYSQAQEALDSPRRMDEVMIVAKRIENRCVGPVQELKGKELKELSVYSVADALRYFSGVQVKDYGGVVWAQRT